MKIPGNWVGGLVLVIMAFGLILFRHSHQSDPPPIAEASVGPEITSHARGITMTSTDASGELAWRMSAAEAWHYDGPDLWVLDQPRWQLYDESAPPWVGRANSGRAWDGTSRADLIDEVVMWRQTPEGLTRLETPFMHIQLPEHYAETDEPVTLIGPDYQVDSVGANAWLREDRIELLENARGRYALDDT